MSPSAGVSAGAASSGSAPLICVIWLIVSPSGLAHGLNVKYRIRYERLPTALLGIDQKALAVLSDVSLPTIQRMEASDGNVRGIVDSLTKIVEALDRAGIELIGENAPSQGRGRGVRLKAPPSP